MFSRRHHAFTLVELLVVISIVSLLIALLLPTLSKARRSASVIRCMANEHQLAFGVLSYTIDSKEWLPIYKASNNGAGGVGSLWPYDWSYLVYPYINYSPDLYTCPARIWSSPLTTADYSSNPLDPSSGQKIKTRVSYRANGSVYFGSGTTASNAPAFGKGFLRAARPFGPVWTYTDAGATWNWTLTENTMKTSDYMLDNNTIMLSESVRYPFTLGGVATVEYSSLQWGIGANVDVTSIAISSHNFESASFTYFDGHSALSNRESLLAATDLGGNLIYTLQTAAGNAQANPGDLFIQNWNSTARPPTGPWSAWGKD